MIEIKNISKEFITDAGFNTPVLSKITFNMPDKKITSLIAPHGSGKSVLLKIISGLEEQTSGDIVNPSSQKIILIPTAPSSFPWLNVYENVKFGLNKCDEKQIQSLINIVGLEGYNSFQCHNRSLGFRFRISLARSLAHNPSAILLDDPFSEMDNKTKNELLMLIRKINKTLGVTFLLATSNVTEALFLTDKVYLMKNDPGEIISESDIDLSSERDESTFTSDPFEMIRTKILTTFKQVESQKMATLSI
ncbi:MAG: ATP-binding cassette domain-containing protein [Ignavibacteriales bacterium]|nr:ATP-binding cassette domain-containing protein [Ignavibacteriales bacterium]